MKNLFNADNIIIKALSFFCDLMYLNILFLISCIPLFTIGTAISALYCIAMKLVRKEDVYIGSSYWQAFRSNFKQSTLLWIPFLFACLFFVADLYIIHNIIDPQYQILQYPIWFLIFVLVSIMIYAFPMIALYENTTKQIIKNSILLSISNIPTTIFIVILHLAIFWMGYRSGEDLIFVFSLAMFFGCAAMAYFCSLFLNRIFEKCTPKEEA